MKTEIQDDFIGYILRFKLPSKECFIKPLKKAGIILLLELILSGIIYLVGIQTWSLVLSLSVCMFIIGYYVGVLYKDFWNVVLEESKGLFADLIMWIYYIAICVISLSPALAIFYLSEI